MRPLDGDALGVIDALAARSSLVLLLDVDGTLAPIAPRPEDAEVPPETRAVVAELAALPDVTVSLVSGRAAADAARVVDVPNVWVIGNHGAERVAPDGTAEVQAEVATFQPAMRAAAAELEGVLRDVPGAIVEDKRLTLSVHYRLAPLEDQPTILAAAHAVAARHGLRTKAGKMVIEVRAPVHVDKGTAVVAFLVRIAAPADAGILFVGDDVTDEDAFIQLAAHAPSAVTVRVAGPDVTTAAEWVVPTPAAVRVLLARIAAVRSLAPAATR